MAWQRNALVTVRRLASIALIAVLAASTAVMAAPADGRLSRDLREGLSEGKASGFRVILQGSAATVDDVVLRYGARVTRKLKTGAVVEVTRDALEAMSADPAIGHLAGDTLVKSMMAVSTQAMGADQAWAGLLPGVAQATGRGIGVAVIDSGVSRHSALQNRMLASLDFTAGSGIGEDQYGHGTHVAGIIGGASDVFPRRGARARTWSA